jgi:elongation factor G
MSDLSTHRRGEVLGMDREGGDNESENGRLVIKALVPLKELVGYSSALRSMTAGNGVFAMDYRGYRIMAGSQDKVLTQVRGY